MSGEPDSERMAHLRKVAAWPFVVHQPQCLGVAVSGGGDSMALLDMMQAVAVERGFAIRAVSVDHGLRGNPQDLVMLSSLPSDLRSMRMVEFLHCPDVTSMSKLPT